MKMQAKQFYSRTYSFDSEVTTTKWGKYRQIQQSIIHTFGLIIQREAIPQKENST